MAMARSDSQEFLGNATLSIIVPCFNEELNLVGTIEKIDEAVSKLEIDSELIIVDDASTDQTYLIAAELLQSRNDVVFLKNEKNMGIGHAFWAGVKESKNSFVVMIPGDGENDPTEVLRYLSLVDHVDVVIPFVMNTHVRGWMRRFVSRLYRSIINLSFGTDFNYTNGTVIYNRAALMTLKAPTGSFFYQTELLVRLSRNYLYAEVPQFIETRDDGVSKAISIRSLRRVIWAFLKLMFEMHILHAKGRRVTQEDFPQGTRTYERLPGRKNSHIND
jgi:dolichol-phosphate mannosyltransferase